MLYVGWDWLGLAGIGWDWVGIGWDWPQFDQQPGDGGRCFWPS